MCTWRGLFLLLESLQLESASAGNEYRSL